ncbi:MAG: hypothetical protein FWD35_00710 [Oscillospiraceae bacterium]|nr:hypothetical protein [Oscillospiraceae bacterium]
MLIYGKNKGAGAFFSNPFSSQNPHNRSPKNTTQFVKEFEGLTQHGNRMRLAAIINTFRSGKRLTSGEMGFLRKHAPDAYGEATRILRQREFMEKQMRSARTKQEVDTIRTVSLTAVAGRREISSGNAETRLAQVNHMANAYHEYSATECYRRKPADYADKARQKRGRRDRFEK